jgi:hypothetical protein
MSVACVEERGWSRRYWWGVVLFVCAVQVVLIFWLGDSSLVRVRAVKEAPGLRLAGPETARFLALSDPTLFARPHRQAFSGQAWMAVEPREFEPYVWSTAPTWLDLSDEQLGAIFHRISSTNAFNPLQLLTQVQPDLTFPAVLPAKLFPEQSVVQVVGALALRPLVSPLELPSWPNPDLLTNSVVQTLVDAEGVPVSATLLLPGSGSREADQAALTLARKARFAALPRVSGATEGARKAGLTWGDLVFAWHTLPLPATNGPNPGPR